MPFVQGDSGLLYTWSPLNGIVGGEEHLQSPHMVLDSSRYYTVTASYPGCTDIVRIVNIGVEPQPVVDLGADTLYRCDNTGLVLNPTVSPAGYSGYSYLWRTNTDLSALQTLQTTFNGGLDTALQLSVSTPHGCIGSDSVWVKVYKSPVVSLPDSVSIYLGQSYQMVPTTNGMLYSWIPTAFLSDTTILNPLAAPTVTTRYVLRVKNEDGCVLADSILIHVSGDESGIGVPNAFNPSGTVNPVIKVLHVGPVKLRYFRIFNRWGNLVFETNDIDEGWDGNYKGTEQPVGVYVYAIEAVTNLGRVVKKTGNVTLLR
jgi:gliding motility-associated-like protein